MSDMSTVLLVDARNIMYRAIHSAKSEERRQAHGRRSPAVIMIRLVANLLSKYKPGMVQIFWDAPRKTVWRKSIHTGYKDRVDDRSGGARDITDSLIRTESTLRQLFDHMNVYQFWRDKQEADDLIYAACKLQGRRPMILVSSDSDMQQIPYLMDSVTIYNHDKGGEMPRPEVNPVLLKCLIGDTSDMIGGYIGIGPVKAAKLVASPALLQEHLERAGNDILRRNLALVDMSLNPYALKNLMYVAEVLATKPEFNRKRIYEMEQTLKIAGLTREYGESVAPFRLIPNE